MQSFLKTSHGINSIQIHEPDGFEDSLEFGIPTVNGETERVKLSKTVPLSEIHGQMSCCLRPPAGSTGSKPCKPAA